jgi:hypothetical protein
MNITSAQYIKIPFTNEPSGIKSTIDGVEMFVPITGGNRHYRAIMEAVEAGELVITEAA